MVSTIGAADAVIGQEHIILDRLNIGVALDDVGQFDAFHQGQLLRCQVGFIPVTVAVAQTRKLVHENGLERGSNQAACNRILSLENHTYVPVFDTSTTARMPSHFTLDARIDKAWVYDRWSLTAYLDLQNATNRRNVEMISWSYDWIDEIPIYGLPIIPAFGVRGEW